MNPYLIFFSSEKVVVILVLIDSFRDLSMAFINCMPIIMYVECGRTENILNFFYININGIFITCDCQENTLYMMTKNEFYFTLKSSEW